MYRRRSLLLCLFWTLLLLTCVPRVQSLSATSREDADFEVISNPHVCRFSNDQESCTISSSSSLATLLLEPYYLMRNVVETQADTFQDVEFRKLWGVPIPIYHMKQPKRLSTAELDFQLILVKDLPKAGHALIHQVPVEAQKARDSWFPGYEWNPIVADVPGAVSYTHLTLPTKA